MQPTYRCTFFLDRNHDETYFMYRGPQVSSSSESEDHDPRDDNDYMAEPEVIQSLSD